MPYFEREQTRIYYEEAGTGFPLLVIPGGGLNSTLSFFDEAPFNPFTELSGEFRCIAADLRNARGSRSTGPVEVERPWDSYTDDHLGLMDHLGISEFLVLGFCIGAPFIWNIIRREPSRVRAAVLAQPSAYRAERPTLFYDNNIERWAPLQYERDPRLEPGSAEAFLRTMYLDSGDFVFTVTREFVQQCRTPLLVMPDDIPAHPYAVAMETARLAPHAQVSLYPWKDAELVPLALRHMRMFLTAHRTATVSPVGAP